MATCPIARAGIGQMQRSGTRPWCAAALVWSFVALGACWSACPVARAANVSRVSPPGEAELAAAEHRCKLTAHDLDEACGRELEARTQLESYVRATFDRLRSTTQALAESLPLPSEEIATPSPVARRAEVRLEELMVEHAQLSERLTPEHPLVQDLEARIANAQEQWHQAVANASRGRAVEKPATTARQSMWTPAALEEVITGYELARRSVEQAARDVDEAQQRHALATRQQLALVESLWQQAQARPAAQAAPATVWPLWPFALGLGLLVIGGGVEVWNRISARLSSVGQIEQLLRVPVVAVLPGRWPAATPERSSMAARGLRLMRLSGQVIVALVVFSLVAASIDTPSWIISLLP